MKTLAFFLAFAFVLAIALPAQAPDNPPPWAFPRNPNFQDVTDDGSLIDAPMSATNLASGAYPDDTIGYEFTAPPVYSTSTVPEVTAVSPSEGPTKGHTAITIKGSNFVAGATVTIGGRATVVHVRSETEITATTTAAMATPTRPPISAPPSRSARRSISAS